MKRTLLKILLTVSLFAAPVILLAQTPPHPNGGNPPGGGNIPVGGGAPIDGGISLLIGLGIAYGAKRVYSLKEEA